MLLRKLLFTLTVVVALMLSPAYAQQGQDDSVRDIRVVVDISGSMKLNDPDNLRRPAVRLLAGLLPDGTGVGLWTFGREVNMLVPHGSLDDPLRNSLNEGSEKINSVAQRTNIGGAIETASDNWFAPGRSLRNTHLILLSDGKVDIAPSAARNNAERERILEQLVPQLASEGLTIHTIALSAEADLDLLGAIADHTGGVARVAGTADELSRIFADTLGQAVAANEVPLNNNRFSVDQGVEEFTALIFSSTAPAERQLTLVTPDGSAIASDESVDGVRWVREVGYDLITIDQPVAGEWQLEGTLGEGSRVTVVSDLKLEVEPLPARFEPGDTLEVRAFFTEDGERITDGDFLRVIEVRLTMTTEDGRQGTRKLSEGEPPVDGVYRDTIAQLQEPGQYQMELEADGGTFSRKYRQALTLTAPEGAAQETGPDVAEETVQQEAVQSEPAGATVPEPAVDGPIDLSQVEESTPVTEGETAEPKPVVNSDAAREGVSLTGLWPWIAGGAGLFVALVAIAVFLLRRRRQAASAALAGADPQPAAGAEASAPEPETSADVDTRAAMEDEDEPRKEVPPVLDDNTDPVPEEALQSEPVGDAEISDAADDQAAAMEEPPVAEEIEPAEAREVSGPEPETLPEDGQEGAQDEPDLQEFAEPDMDSAKEASRADDPGLDEFDDSLLEDEDGDEFGLEDFDLSDIDDLPDLDAEEDEITRRQKPSQEEGKKDD
ncbi:VWA domain-containing protein [Marinobacter segnicrescens]|uniref:VWA domain-containing protein n=1 Tax=Marinobacter segnicrescens TaxID=430453 RepID=UPI003A8D2DA5